MCASEACLLKCECNPVARVSCEEKEQENESNEAEKGFERVAVESLCDDTIR